MVRRVGWTLRRRVLVGNVLDVAQKYVEDARVGVLHE